MDVAALRVANAILARVYHRTIVRSPQRLPRHGPGILICNHISGLDPMLIQSVCPRLIVWMMAKEYYEIRALRWLFKTIEAIPVDRGGRDLAATRSGAAALETAGSSGVFPEGRIETSRDLLPFQTGVAMMAIKAGVPVYPAYLDGTQRGKEMVGPSCTRRTATAHVRAGGGSSTGRLRLESMLQAATEPNRRRRSSGFDRAIRQRATGGNDRWRSILPADLSESLGDAPAGKKYLWSFPSRRPIHNTSSRQ